MTEATIIVGGWSSLCSACGRNADPREDFHLQVTMQGEGCGAKYVAIESGYTTGNPDFDRKNLERIRTDLPIRTLWTDEQGVAGDS